MDYNLLMQTSSFQMGQTRVCTNIAIQEDTIVEVTETFTVTLTGNANVAVNNTAGTATVFIRDTNGKFEDNSYIITICIQSVYLDITLILYIHEILIHGAIFAAAERMQKVIDITSHSCVNIYLQESSWQFHCRVQTLLLNQEMIAPVQI